MEEKGKSRIVYGIYIFFFSAPESSESEKASKDMLIIITVFVHLTSGSVIFLFETVNNQLFWKSHNHTRQDHIQIIVNRTTIQGSAINSSFPRSGLDADF